MRAPASYDAYLEAERPQGAEREPPAVFAAVITHTLPHADGVDHASRQAHRLVTDAVGSDTPIFALRGDSLQPRWLRGLPWAEYPVITVPRWRLHDLYRERTGKVGTWSGVEGVGIRPMTSDDLLEQPSRFVILEGREPEETAKLAALAAERLPPGHSAWQTPVTVIGADLTRRNLRLEELAALPHVARLLIRLRLDYCWRTNFHAIGGAAWRAAVERSRHVVEERMLDPLAVQALFLCARGALRPVMDEHGVGVEHVGLMHEAASRAPDGGWVWRGTGKHPSVRLPNQAHMTLAARLGYLVEFDSTGYDRGNQPVSFLMTPTLTPLGRSLLERMHPDCEDVDLPNRMALWEKQGAAGMERADRYIRTYFGKWKRFLGFLARQD